MGEADLGGADLGDAETGEQSWRWCCRAGRWIPPGYPPPGGAGEGGGGSNLCEDITEDDVALVGDADKVTQSPAQTRTLANPNPSQP